MAAYSFITIQPWHERVVNIITLSKYLLGCVDLYIIAHTFEKDFFFLHIIAFNDDNPEISITINFSQEKSDQERFS